MARVPPYDPTAHRGPVRRLLRRFAQTPFGTWTAINVGPRVDPVLMKVSGGRVRLPSGVSTVLLTHTGAKSGKRRTTPLVYFTDGDDVVLIASRGGDTRHPAWYHNVRANPDVELWAGGRGGPYRARQAEGEERERLWELATTMYPGYDAYQEKTGGRLIPVVVCEPRDAD